MLISVLFNLLYLLGLLLLFPWLVVFRTGRYRRNLWAKLFGWGESLPASNQPVIWFHGVSVGEIHLLRHVVSQFRARHPEWSVVISSTTDTGLAEAHEHFADLPIVVYPFDFSWSVHRAIQRVRPRVIVLAESELWPNFLRAAEQHQIPVVVINGRMSPRTFRRFSKVAWLARKLLFRRIALFAVQSESYAQNYQNLGLDSSRILVTGSVKYDGIAIDSANSKTAELRGLLQLGVHDLVWVAGSTHAPEEQVVTAIYQRLLERFRQLRLIIVPRAPERFDEVARLIESTGLACRRRSQTNIGTASTERAVILIDTLGELAAVWGLATIGFTGGSLSPKRGGQSMIEPAGLGVPVLFGPNTWNFRDAVTGLLEAKAAIRVADEQHLEAEVIRLLNDPELRQRMGQVGRDYVRAQQGATQRTLDALEAFLTRGNS